MLVIPLHTEGIALVVTVGAATTVTCIGCEEPEHPAIVLLTTKLALYVPAAAPTGTVITIGLLPKVAFITFVKP